MHVTVRRLVLGGLAVAASAVWLALAAVMLAEGQISLSTAMQLFGIWVVGGLALSAVVIARRAAMARALNTRLEGVAASHNSLEHAVTDLASTATRIEQRVTLIEQRVEAMNAIPTDLRSLDTKLTGIAEAANSASRGATSVLDAIRAFDDIQAAVTALGRTHLPELRVDLRRFIAATGINDYEQVVAWTELRELLDIDEPMPALRGWAASPDVLRIVIGEILRIQPRLVVECGSGSSSVWLGYALRKVGGRLVSLEHDAAFAEVSRSLVADHHLEDVVEVRVAPLTAFDRPQVDDESRESQPWYDLTVIQDLEAIELLFVDGPPGDIADLARYPAVPALLDRCADSVVIVLDDAARPDETAVVQRWLAENPELQGSSASAEKGAFVLRRSADR